MYPQTKLQGLQTRTRHSALPLFSFPPKTKAKNIKRGNDILFPLAHRLLCTDKKHFRTDDHPHHLCLPPPRTTTPHHRLCRCSSATRQIRESSITPLRPHRSPLVAISRSKVRTLPLCHRTPCHIPPPTGSRPTRKFAQLDHFSTSHRSCIQSNPLAHRKIRRSSSHFRLNVGNIAVTWIYPSRSGFTSSNCLRCCNAGTVSTSPSTF